MKIDESNVKDHHYLELPEDECFYLKEYKSGFGYKGGDTNSLILNFKKIAKRESPESFYKEQAMKCITSMLVEILKNNKNIKHFTFVPIPPSKEKSDPSYDARLLYVLRRVSKKLSMLDELSELNIRELFSLKESMQTSHKTKNRLKKDALKKLIFLDDNQLRLTTGKTIILFDDVLTTGAHFKACKELLKEKLPDIRIIGLFIARTIRPLQCD